MERILLFLRQNGGASMQARQVASLAFIIGEQVVQLGGWKWMSVSDDGSVNPADRLSRRRCAPAWWWT